MDRSRIAVIVLVVSAVYFPLYFWLRQSPEKAIHLSYTQAFGYGVGELLARDFPRGGRVLYLVPGASDEVIEQQFHPHADGIRAGFGHEGLTVEVVIGEGEHAPRRSIPEMVGISPNPLANATAVVRRNGEVAAIVANITPSELPAESILRQLPPLYVLDAGADPRWPEILRHKLVRGVVTRNPEADLMPMPKGIQPAAEVFALRYRIVSP